MEGATEVSPQVHQLTILGVNVVLIAEESLTLVDTGLRGSSSRILSFIRSLGRSPEELSLIILTHNHLDHVGGLAELKRYTQAKVAAHKAGINSTGDGLSYPGVVRKLLFTPALSAVRPSFLVTGEEVDVLLEGGEILEPLGGLKVIHTPGHTPGSISLLSIERKLLIVGDTLNHTHKNLRFPPKMVSTDFKQAVESVRGLAKLDFEILCPGHGRPILANARMQVEEFLKVTKV